MWGDERALEKSATTGVGWGEDSGWQWNGDNDGKRKTQMDDYYRIHPSPQAVAFHWVDLRWLTSSLTSGGRGVTTCGIISKFTISIFTTWEEIPALSPWHVQTLTSVWVALSHWSRTVDRRKGLWVWLCASIGRVRNGGTRDYPREGDVIDKMSRA